MFKHEFLLDLFITEGFNVITREGLTVSIGAIDTLTDHGHQIIGWVTNKQGLKTSYAWDLTGKMYGWSKGSFSHDLFLVLK
jgi:hypothetical protein